MINETLIPSVVTVSDIRTDTPDVKTFRVLTKDGKKPFIHKPGQCAMLSIPGVGEAMFSITSSPTNTEYMEFSIKKCGCLTEWLHAIEVGQQLTIRGPYGNAFPVDTELKGKNLLFIAGGIGLAPLRSVINYCRHYRENYGTIDIIYGSRSKDDLVDYKEIIDEWCKEDGVNVHLTIDREQEGWAKMLYDVLDNTKIFNCHANKEDRSDMNVTFRTASADLDALFASQAEEQGLSNLKGHRKVGGMRASIYNAMPVAGVEKLCDFIRAFDKQYG